MRRHTKIAISSMIFEPKPFAVGHADPLMRLSRRQRRGNLLDAPSARLAGKANPCGGLRKFYLLGKMVMPEPFAVGHADPAIGA